jgi:protein SCO1/2
MRGRAWTGWWACAALGAAVAGAPVRAQVIHDELPPQVRGLDIRDRLGTRVPTDIVLTDSAGRQVTTGAYFDGRRPVVLAMLYYDCPLACPLILQRLQESLNGVEKTYGASFRVVVVSFDPRSTTEQAAHKRDLTLQAYNRKVTAEVAAGVEFHTASEAEARRLADAIGFDYRYLPDVGEFAHPAAIFVLSSEGAVSRALIGFDYPARDVTAALLEASRGRIASTLGEYFLYFCYHFDDATGRYSPRYMAIMRAGALTTLGLLTATVVWLKARERSRRPAAGTERIAQGGLRGRTA